MPHEAEVTIDFKTRLEAQAFRAAIQPETRKPSTHRSRLHVTAFGKKVRLKIIASDTVALRAALNSYLRIALAWKKVVEAVRPSSR